MRLILSTIDFPTLSGEGRAPPCRRGRKIIRGIEFFRRTRPHGHGGRPALPQLGICGASRAA